MKYSKCQGNKKLNFLRFFFFEKIKISAIRKISCKLMQKNRKAIHSNEREKCVLGIKRAPQLLNHVWVQMKCVRIEFRTFNLWCKWEAEQNRRMKRHEKGAWIHSNECQLPSDTIGSDLSIFSQTQKYKQNVPTTYSLAFWILIQANSNASRIVNATLARRPVLVVMKFKKRHVTIYINPSSGCLFYNNFFAQASVSSL